MKYLFPVEVRDPNKYPSKGAYMADVDVMSAHWTSQEVMNTDGALLSSRSPITQVFTHSCLLKSHCCVLTAGEFTWFCKRTLGTLKISQAFRMDSESPSLAQAWVIFVQLAFNAKGEEKEVTPDFENFVLLKSIELKENIVKRVQKSKESKMKNKEAALSRSSNDNVSEAALSRSSSDNVSESVDASDDLPLEKLSCAFQPTESFGPLNHGVIAR